MYWGQKAPIKVPTHKGKHFRASNYIDGSHISQFIAHFRKFSIFRTPCLVKIHFEIVYLSILDKRHQKKTPSHKGKLFLESNYID